MSLVLNTQGTHSQAACNFMFTGIGQTDIKVRAQYAAPNGTQIKVQQAKDNIVGPGKPPVTQEVLIRGPTLALKIKLQYLLPSGHPKDVMLTVGNLYQ